MSTRWQQRIIVITGFMGSGKTLVAKALAHLLNCQMLDLDSIISEQENQSVSELIKERGEATFRDAETYALQLILERKPARIIALGGGAWTLERNRNLINENNCLTIFLDAPFELCWKRITEQDAVRPLALDRPGAHKLFHERHPIYELADLRIKVTEEASSDELASEIDAAMKRRGFVKA
jgi:shikimate kinase